MRSGAELRAILVLATLALAAPALAQDPAQDVERSDTSATRAEITQRDIEAAMDVVRNDPNLSAERKTRTLRWVDDNKPPPKDRKTPGWMEWLADLFVWLAQNGRFLFWGVLVVLAAMLIIYLVRLISGWRMPERSRPFDVPSFVRDLDIRPESLPNDIGSAARQLWDGGDHRAALSLLYRGLLSRLVHVHDVPIKDSTTEGDCLALANKHLFDDARKRYVAKLVRLWQRAVYGGEQAATESVYELCDEFSRALDDPEAPPAGAQPAAGVSS